MDEIVSEYVIKQQEEAKALETVFGAEFKAVQANRVKIALGALASFKAKVEQMAPAYEERRSITRKIPKFWWDVISKSNVTSALAKDDEGPLSHLTDLWMEHSKEDPREYSFTFEFSENPYFSDAQLVKSFKLADVPADAKDVDVALLRSYDLSYPLKSEPVKINWKSEDKDVTKKHPRIDPAKLEEFDEFEGIGSFFCWFGEDSDQFDIGEHLIEVFQNAYELHASLFASFDSDEESEDDDPNAEIDIEESEDEKRDTKRKRKN